MLSATPMATRNPVFTATREEIRTRASFQAGADETGCQRTTVMIHARPSRTLTRSVLIDQPLPSLLPERATMTARGQLLVAFREVPCWRRQAVHRRQRPGLDVRVRAA